MTPDQYLQALLKKLKGFSHADRAVLVEEISSHIESGEEDPKLGKDPAQRRDKLMAELGSPEQMVKGFKMIYQPDGLIDFLLVAIPLLLNTSINLLMVSLMPRYPWFDVRVEVLFRLVLIGIGIWRGSKLLILAWVPRTAIQIIAMLALTQGYFLHQSIIWLPVLLGLIYLFGRVIWQNRRDTLIVIFGLLPLIIGSLGIALDFVPEIQILAGRIDLSILQAFSRFSVVLDGLNIAAFGCDLPGQRPQFSLGVVGNLWSDSRFVDYRLSGSSLDMDRGPHAHRVPWLVAGSIQTASAQICTLSFLYPASDRGREAFT